MANKQEPGSFEVIAGLATVVFLFILVPMFCDGDSSTNTPTKNPPEYYKPGAFMVAETFVKRELKSPGSAKFPTSSSERRNSVKVLSDGVSYKIDSWVDSQNSFGALKRVYFTCTIKRYGRSDEWELIDIKLLE